MSDSLTTLIGKVQNILGDPSATYFTTTLVTAAIRQALSDWNITAPQHLAVTITGVNDQYEYELSDEDSSADEILDVLSQGDNQNELDTSITYDAYTEDERIFFRLRSPVTSSDTLIVRYTKPHTINGLDSQVESTLRAQDDQAIVNGGAFYSIVIRATSRIESNNLEPNQDDSYRDMAAGFRSAFDTRLQKVAQTRKAPVGEPDTRAWNDTYHHWDI